MGDVEKKNVFKEGSQRGETGTSGGDFLNDDSTCIETCIIVLGRG
jgi:hypothetical protein